MAITQADFDKLDRLAAALRGKLACQAAAATGETFTRADGKAVAVTYSAAEKTACDSEAATALADLKAHVAKLAI